MYIYQIKMFYKAILILLGITLINFNVAAADAPEAFRVVDGVAIYVGVIPAQVVEGYSNGNEENTMHGGTSKSAHRDHVVVALFDSTSGKRIEDAKVTGSVTELGLRSQHKKFEAMKIAGTITYGNYFNMPDNNTYHIKVQIRRPGMADVIETTFTHQHFSK